MKPILFILFPSIIAAVMIYADITAKPAIIVQTTNGVPRDFVYAGNADFTNIFSGDLALIERAEFIPAFILTTNNSLTITNRDVLWINGTNFIPILNNQDYNRIVKHPGFKTNITRKALITIWNGKP